MQLPNNSYEIIKTVYLKGIAQPISEKKTLQVSDGRDIVLYEGDTLIQFSNGQIDVIRGAIDLNNGIYSIEKEAKIVENSENLIDYRKIQQNINE